MLELLNCLLSNVPLPFLHKSDSDDSRMSYVKQAVLEEGAVSVFTVIYWAHFHEVIGEEGF